MDPTLITALLKGGGEVLPIVCLIVLWIKLQKNEENLAKLTESYISIIEKNSTALGANSAHISECSRIIGEAASAIERARQ